MTGQRHTTLNGLAAPRALGVAITPCLQRTLIFSSLALDAVNRAHRVILSPGGKSVNAARALGALGIQCHLLGYCGAETGMQLRRLLSQCGIGGELLSMAHPTRTCTTLIDTSGGTVTELVEEAPQPTTAEWRAYEARLQTLLPQFELVIAAGALPPGAASETYARVARLAAENRTALLLDANGAALMQALSYAPLLVKLNDLELAATVEMRFKTSADLISAGRQLARAGAHWVLVTRASQPALLVSETEAWQFHPPSVRAVNPVGSGDATTGGIAFALLQGQSMVQAVQLGIGCGSANATTFTAGEITASLAERLARKVRLQRNDS